MRVLTRSGSAYYGSGELYVNISKNENWVTGDGCLGITEEYTEKAGRVVLRRTYNLNGSVAEMLSTYYVYDDFGSVAFVLPPGANPDLSSGVPLAPDYIYQYTYDSRKRLVEKKVPGMGWQYMVYNKFGQLVFSQDSLLKTSGKWLFNKYDGQGRAIITDAITNAATRTSLQATVDGSTVFWEERDDANSSRYEYRIYEQCEAKYISY